MTETATAVDIRKAYRKLVLRVHPDKRRCNSQAEEKLADDEFHKLQQAYEALTHDDEMLASAAK